MPGFLGRYERPPALVPSGRPYAQSGLPRKGRAGAVLTPTLALPALGRQVGAKGRQRGLWTG